jgi:hypothetical protein
MSPKTPRFHPQAGIALGPILFVIALLGVIAAVIAADPGGFSTAGATDRIAADIQSQASLIRTKINECNIKYGTNLNYDGYPSSDTSNGTLVSALNCDGDPSGLQNLWNGERATTLPPPTQNFGAWYYMNTNGTGLGGTATGGRCIWIAPTISNPSSDAALVDGLTKAANKFTHQTTCSNNTTCGAAEVIYDPASASQKFILWISIPTGSPDSHCLP